MGDVVRHVQCNPREIGVTVVKIGFATGGHSEHTRRQHLVITAAQSTTQLALFVRMKVAVFHKIDPFHFETFVVCESKANRALAQARPIDALHLTSLAGMCLRCDFRFFNNLRILDVGDTAVPAWSS